MHQQSNNHDYEQLCSRNPHSESDGAANHSVYATQEGRTNALPLSMHKDWTGKAAPALHFPSAITIVFHR
jgi:hypothetical protein